MSVRIELMGWMLMLGCVLPAVSAAEPDVVWPTEWTVFGPFPPNPSVPYGQPGKQDVLPGEALRAVPRELTVWGKTLRPQRLSVQEGRLNLGQKLGLINRGAAAYLLAPVTATADTTVEIAAGADWWMQWWVDGDPVYDTLVKGIVGNGPWPITGRDHVFQLRLTKGEHVLAVAVFSGNRSFELAVTGPQDLRESPIRFQDAMDAGERSYQRSHWSIPLDSPGASAYLQQAAGLAATDGEKTAAHLALADSYLQDVIGAIDPAAIRQEYAAVLATKGASAGQKAQATLGIGETWLLENECDRARQEFEEARGIDAKPDFEPVVAFAIARSHLQEGDYQAAREQFTRLMEDASLEPLFRFQARSLLAAAELAPRVRPDHPRLFFNAQIWPGVKARAEADNGEFAKLKEQARSLPDGLDAKSFISSSGRLMSAALVYRVTRDPVLLGRIRKLLRAGADWFLTRANFNAHMDARIAWVTAMDWVWNDLPPAERDALARDLVRYAYSRHVDDIASGGTKIDGYGFAYEGNMYWYVGLLLVNSGLEGADRLRALTLMGRGYESNVRGRGGFSDLAEITRDGSVSWNLLGYSFGSMFTDPVWSFMYCLRSAVGGRIPDEWVYIGIPPEYALRSVLGIRKGGDPRRSVRDFGFSRDWRCNGGWTGYAQDLSCHLARFIYFFGKERPRDAAIAAWLRGRLAQAGATGVWRFPFEPYLLDVSTASEARLPDDLALARHYHDGTVFMSSAFEPGATRALFCCGRNDPTSKLKTAASEHFDTTHFTIFKQGYLALDSGTRAMSSDVRLSGNSGANYDVQSVAHNVVLIRMPAEPMRSVSIVPGNRLTEANSGGQYKYPHFANPLAFESDRLFAYIATDATPTYYEEKCAQMVRQFLFLPPDHFVVFDRVTSKNPDYPKTWLLHTANEPVFNGKEFRADQEEGRIFCRTLYPLDAVLEKIGGPGKEFWADGRNWPIPPDSPYLPSIGTDSPDNVPENMGRWRVEVKPGAPRTEDCFLHLIQVSDQTVEKMVGSQVSDKGNRVELAFTVGARSYTISLNKTGDVGGHITIAEGGKMVVDKDLTREVPPPSANEAR